jgi:hypothetical protein
LGHLGVIDECFQLLLLLLKLFYFFQQSINLFYFALLAKCLSLVIENCDLLIQLVYLLVNVLLLKSVHLDLCFRLLHNSAKWASFCSG